MTVNTSIKCLLDFFMNCHGQISRFNRSDYFWFHANKNKIILTNQGKFTTGHHWIPPSNKDTTTYLLPLSLKMIDKTTMGKPSPPNIIESSQFSTVDQIPRELVFENLEKQQDQLDINVQSIKIPCIQIVHTALVYDTPTYMHYNLFPWKPPQIMVSTLDSFSSIPLGLKTNKTIT